MMVAVAAADDHYSRDALRRRSLFTSAFGVREICCLD